jgi:Ca2+-binding RTX toxin-like protein
LTGNGVSQIIIGNAGANAISGKTGNDTLTGLGGADVFVFDTTLDAATNVDAISDFSVADDTISLAGSVFAQIVGTGTLSAGQFVANATGLAADSNDRIVYETDTGQLFYDSNGSGAGGSVLFATLDADLALTNADFIVI